MAPEILLDMPYDTTADYFSLGLIIYRMAVGKHPYFRIGMTTKKMKRIATESTVKYPKNMDPALVDLIKRFLEKSPDLRYQLVSEIRNHPFIRNIDWAYLETGTAAPITYLRPYLEPPVHQRIELADIMSMGQGFLLTSEEQELFGQFSYTSERLRLQM
ncbi:rhodopsin kinase GRK1-like [Pyxicephalus adspersus]|uniref:rhodopsin kinase GRK1-like n=1 Tax=Pyxicephalus adspersus TaxID=30357 RepID=UPI003B5953E0